MQNVMRFYDCACSGVRHLSRVSAVPALLFACALPPGLVHGQGAASFPDVPLVDGSVPRFASLALDAKGDHPLFVLFDGNSETDYHRAYVWVPGHSLHGQPAAMVKGENNQFPPLAIPVAGKPGTETIWSLSASIHVQTSAPREAGERTVSRHDYVTGRTVTSTERWEASEGGTTRSPQFGFNVRYRHAGAGGEGVATAKDLLDLEISGGLPVGAKWTERPAPLTPWAHLQAQGMMELSRDGETPDSGTIRLRTGLSGSGLGCRIASMPQDARVVFEILPYLQDPVASESLPATQALSGGFEAVVPFGWYQVRIKWNVEGITVGPYGTEVFPFPRQ